MDEHEEVSVAELRRNLADVLNAAVLGRPTVITNRGRAIAVIGPLSLIATRGEANEQAE